MGDQVTIDGLVKTVQGAFVGCFTTYLAPVETEKLVKITKFIEYLSYNICEFYVQAECHYMDGLTTKMISSIMINRVNRRFPTLLALTNNFEEFAAMPINDYTKKTFDHSGDTFSMTENQPIDATETITTPYIKVKGKNNYGYTDTTEHNTIEEFEKRYGISERTQFTVQSVMEEAIKSVLYEYNRSY